MTIGMVTIQDGKEFSAPPDTEKTWLRPVSLSPADTTSSGERLAGGWMRFTHLDVVMRTNKGFEVWRCDIESYRKISGSKQAADAALHRLVRPRKPIAGMSLSRPHTMGVLNITPDSFSDGGDNYSAEAAIASGLRMVSEGASMLDIGGESTRPGAAEVSIQEEIERIKPVIAELSSQGTIISCDTRHPEVMRFALHEGVDIINDVSGFTANGAAELMGAQFLQHPDKSFAMAMHMQGTPKTMQNNPQYDFAPIDVYEVLVEHVERLVDAGLPHTHIVVDPGFGFGKTPLHNRQLIDWTSLFHGLGVGILVGVSRKSSIPKLVAASSLGLPPFHYGKAEYERLGGSIALALEAVGQGAQFIRTHDVAPTTQAIAIKVR